MVCRDIDNERSKENAREFSSRFYEYVIFNADMCIPLYNNKLNYFYK